MLTRRYFFPLSNNFLNKTGNEEGSLFKLSGENESCGHSKLFIDHLEMFSYGGLNETWVFKVIGGMSYH